MRLSAPYVFCHSRMREFLEENVTRIRHTSVIVQQITQAEDLPRPQFQSIRGTVASVRLDSVIALAFSSSRSSMLGLIEGGKVFVNDREISSFNKKQLTQYRRESIGFVFQFYNLMPSLTVLENVELASQICKNPLDAREVLDMVGLGERAGNFPAQCSGGEQQRGAIARALAKNPDVLLCDEPTGALDYVTGKAILALLYDLCKQSKKTVVVVTHNGALAPTADVLIRMKSGKIESFEENPNPVPVQELEW